MACFTKVPGLSGPGQRGRRCPQGARVKQHKASEAHGLGLEVELLNLVQRVKNDKTREHIAVTGRGNTRLQAQAALHRTRSPSIPGATCPHVQEPLGSPAAGPTGGTDPTEVPVALPPPMPSPTPVTEGPARQAQGSEARVLGSCGTTSVPSWLFPGLLGQGARRRGGGGTFLGEGKGRQTFGHSVRRSHSARLTVPEQAGGDAVGTASAICPDPPSDLVVSGHSHSCSHSWRLLGGW